MQILTINLPDRLVSTLNLTLPERFLSVSSLESAISMIDSHDFASILLSTEQSPDYEDILLDLVARTPVYTHIIVLCAEPAIDLVNYWQDLGVEFVMPVSLDHIVSCLKANPL